MAYYLFREAIRNDMEIKFGGREALHQAVEEQRAAAIEQQVATALSEGEELSAEVLSDLSEDIREKLMEKVISRIWNDADPDEKQFFVEETRASQQPQLTAAEDDGEDEEGSDTPIGVSRKIAGKKALSSRPRETAASEQTTSKASEKNRKKDSVKEKPEPSHKNRRPNKEALSRADSESDVDERTRKPKPASKASSKAASKRKSSGTAATEPKRQAASGASGQSKAKEASSSKKKRKQAGSSKVLSRGKGRGSSGGGRENKGNGAKLVELLAGFGLKHGDKEWIQVEWAVQKTGKDADEWMQWFNASVDLRKPVGFDEDNRPKWPIHYSRCGTLAATKSKVSFVSTEQLLDDFDSEPMNWRMKRDDLQDVVPQLKRSSSMAGSTSSSSANDREAEWRDDLGTKPRSRR